MARVKRKHTEAEKAEKRWIVVSSLPGDYEPYMLVVGRNGYDEWSTQQKSAKRYDYEGAMKAARILTSRGILCVAVFVRPKAPSTAVAELAQAHEAIANLTVEMNASLAQMGERIAAVEEAVKAPAAVVNNSSGTNEWFELITYAFGNAPVSHRMDRVARDLPQIVESMAKTIASHEAAMKNVIESERMARKKANDLDGRLLAMSVEYDAMRKRAEVAEAALARVSARIDATYASGPYLCIPLADVRHAIRGAA